MTRVYTEKQKAENRERMRAYNLANRASIAAKARVYRAANKEVIAVRKKEGYDQAAQRRRNLKAHYGMSDEDFSEMLGEQMGCCKGCGCSFRMSKPLGADTCHIDHDHKTGKVRGLLCSNCNSALGHVKDSPATMRRLAAYVEVVNAR